MALSNSFLLGRLHISLVRILMTLVYMLPGRFILELSDHCAKFDQVTTHTESYNFDHVLTC